MPIYRFWSAAEYIERLKAENNIETLNVLRASQASQKDVKDFVSDLKSIMGNPFRYDSVEMEKDAIKKINRFLGIN